MKTFFLAGAVAGTYCGVNAAEGLRPISPRNQLKHAFEPEEKIALHIKLFQQQLEMAQADIKIEDLITNIRTDCIPTDPRTILYQLADAVIAMNNSLAPLALETIVSYDPSFNLNLIYNKQPFSISSELTSELEERGRCEKTSFLTEILNSFSSEARQYERASRMLKFMLRKQANANIWFMSYGGRKIYPLRTAICNLDLNENLDKVVKMLFESTSTMLFESTSTTVDHLVDHLVDEWGPDLCELKAFLSRHRGETNPSTVSAVMEIIMQYSPKGLREKIEKMLKK